MTAIVLFNGTVDVQYAYINVHDVEEHVGERADEGEERREEFRGQVNGLCGAARPGVLRLVTGLHTGEVGFTVELHSSEPAVGDEWEDVVEVSFRSDAGLLGLHGFESQEPFDLAPGQYRVRYCARGMDAGQAEDTLDGDDPVDFYLLQFWPGQPAGDRIVREHSKAAAFWHHATAGRSLTSTEQQDLDSEQAEVQRDEDYRLWGDRIPNARLRANDSFLMGFLEQLDLDAVFALSEADDAVHRQVAAWAALRTMDIAGFTELPALAPAVAALRRGEPVPPPFDSAGYMWSKFSSAMPHTSAKIPPNGDEEESQQNRAIVAMFYTAHDDSFTAAYSALASAAGAYGMDYRRLFNEFRQVFPQLDTRG